MPRNHYYRYDNDRYYQRRRRGGCWYRLKRFVFGVTMTVISLLAGFLLIGLIVLASSYGAYVKTGILILVGIGGILLFFIILKFVIKHIADMVNTISAMRMRLIAAKRAKIDLSKRQIERDEYRQRLEQPRHARQGTSIQQSLPASSSTPAPEKLARVIPKLTVPLQPAQQSEVPGMPEFTTVPYRTIQHAIQPGQLVALVRADGSPRLEDWNAFKILLVLGGSSSGKTTTMAEKVLGFVIGGGLIVPCDPHETKQDSLTKKIYPLAPALYPGAVFAVEHHTILQNMRLVTAILEDRINGAESSIPVLLVVEELNRLLRDKAIAKEVSRILETLGEEGRGYNVFVLVGCQRVTYLSDIRKACISFIVHRCDESEAQLVIPQRYAKYCPELRPGQCFVKDSNGVTEAGLQALVTHQDMERASVRLTHQQIERPLQHPSVRPGLHLPQRQGYGRPTRSLSGTVDSSQRTPHKTRLQPVQPNAEESRGDTSNPLHTWTYEQPTGDTSQPESPVLPDSPSESPRITEELNPSDLSPEQQLAILVMRRKKKNPKTKENES